MRLIQLQQDFILNKSNDPFVPLLLFFNYLAVTEKDSKAYQYVTCQLKSLKPEYIRLGNQMFDRHQGFYAEKLETLMDEFIAEIHFDETLCIGFSMHFFQWIPANIIARKIKERHPDSPIVIGGIGAKEKAMAFLNNFPSFDYAVWGEGEIPLLQLCTELKKTNEKPCLENIPNLAYRENDKVVVSSVVNHRFPDLALPELRPDYSEFFVQNNQYLKNPMLLMPIEGSRSCYWKKCKFCYLNNGYKYRTKPLDVIRDEIIHCIEQYKVYDFEFLDNDITGNDYNRFDALLDIMIKIKGQYPKFRIVGAETITKGLTVEIIQKMFFAGFEILQIGYESLSARLLKKIEKKNTFASNLLAIKWMMFYHIRIIGVNVLRGLLEETTEDIYESMDNLHSLRFLFSSGFSQRMSALSIDPSSKYYPQARNNLYLWRNQIPLDLFPENYLKEENLPFLMDKLPLAQDPVWKNFRTIEQYYLKNKFEYTVVAGKDTIVYCEYLNDKEINRIEMPYPSLYASVLKHSNGKVVSIDELEILCLKENHEVSKSDLKEAVDELIKENILYCTDDYTEIVSVIHYI